MQTSDDASGSTTVTQPSKMIYYECFASGRYVLNLRIVPTGSTTKKVSSHFRVIMDVTVIYAASIM